MRRIKLWEAWISETEEEASAPSREELSSWSPLWPKLKSKAIALVSDNIEKLIEREEEADKKRVEASVAMSFINMNKIKAIAIKSYEEVLDDLIKNDYMCEGDRNGIAIKYIDLISDKLIHLIDDIGWIKKNAIHIAIRAGEVTPSNIPSDIIENIITRVIGVVMKNVINTPYRVWTRPIGQELGLKPIFPKREWNRDTRSYEWIKDWAPICGGERGGREQELRAHIKSRIEGLVNRVLEL